MDMQGNLSAAWLSPEILKTTSGTMKDVIESTYDPNKKQWSIKDIIRHTEHGVDIAPSNLALAPMELTLASDPTEEGQFLLRDKLAELKKGHSYDYIIIDTGPSVSYLAISAHMAADAVLIPMTPDFFSLIGTDSMDMILARVQKKRARLKDVQPLVVYGVISRVQQSYVITRDFLNIIKEKFGATMFNTQIRESVYVRESPSHQEPIFNYDPDGTGSQDFMQLAEEVIRHVPPTK
jgi:chromosome partitioning protein